MSQQRRMMMQCPRCDNPKSGVIETVPVRDRIRRRRRCQACGHRWTTMEMPVLLAFVPYEVNRSHGTVKKL